MSLTHPATPDHSLMHRALMRRGVCYSPEQGEGGGTPPAEPKPTEKPAAPTPEQIAADAVKAAREQWDKEAAEKAAKAKEEADRVAAEKQGEFQKLYEGEKADRESVEADNDALRVENTIVRTLAQPKYVHLAEREKFVVAYLKDTVDTKKLKGEDLKKAIADSIDEYDKAHPAQPAKPPVAGAPLARPSGGRVSPTRQPQQRTSTAGVASSRF